MKWFTRNEAVHCVLDGIMRIPDGYEALYVDFAYYNCRSDLPLVKTLIIPGSVTRIDSMRGDSSMGPFGFDKTPFCQIIVDEKNPCFKAKNGVLFTKDMESLICYPRGKKERSYTIPDGVKRIETDAFLEVVHLKRVRLPNSLERVEYHAFMDCLQLQIPRRKKGVYYDDEYYSNERRIPLTLSSHSEL